MARGRPTVTLSTPPLPSMQDGPTLVRPLNPLDPTTRMMAPRKNLSPRPTSSAPIPIGGPVASTATSASTTTSTTCNPDRALDDDVDDDADLDVSPSTANSSSVGDANDSTSNDANAGTSVAVESDLAFDSASYFPFSTNFSSQDDIFATTSSDFVVSDEKDDEFDQVDVDSHDHEDRPSSNDGGRRMRSPHHPVHANDDHDHDDNHNHDHDHRANQMQMPPIGISRPRVIAPAMKTPQRNVSTARTMAMASRRKNSIEMFLSQSPSQALGGEFLKLSLDDRRPSSSSGLVSTTTTPSDLDLEREPTPERHKAYRRYLSSPPASVSDMDADVLDKETAWSSSSSDAALNSTTSVSVPMSSPRGYYYEQQQQQQQQQPTMPSSRYYNGQATVSSSSSNPMLYRQSSLDTAYSMQSSHDPMLQMTQQWQASSGYSSSSGMASPDYPPMHMAVQQMPPPFAMQPQYPSMQPRTTSRGFVRSQSMTSTRYPTRSPPMSMVEASPPHSPRHMLGMSANNGSSNGLYSHVGTKQCKFFLQGHCRMGNKCKFAHHHPPSMGYPPSMPMNVGPSSYAPMQQAMPTEMHLQHQHQQQQQQHVGAFARSASARSIGNSTNAAYRMNDLGSSMASVSQHHANYAVSPEAPSMNLLQPEDVQGRVFAMSKDQNGCRLLQEQLDYGDDRKLLCDVIYREAMDHLAEMMVDPFGNYLFQKLLERARPLQRLEMIRRVANNLVAAALNLHGTRSVQKVVEVCATSPEVVELDSDGHELRRVNLPDLLVAALEDDAVRLCIDSNGNHVIQRALQFMKPQYNQFVFDAVCVECLTVGTHRHGCCVLQRCLDAADVDQKRSVIFQVEKQAMKLMQDPYGNYVVQYVLDSCSAEDAHGVLTKPLGHIYDLSIQKFSSNVIEKCLEKASASVLTEYVDEITHCSKLQKMLQDQFANYVVQRALCVAHDDQCLDLVAAIRPHLAAMRNTSGGRRITARILKRFPHMDLSMELGFEPTMPGLLQLRSNPGGNVGGAPPSMAATSTSMFGSSGLTYMPTAGMGLGLHQA